MVLQLLMVLTFLGSSTAATALPQASVFSLQPNTGSMAGGTYLVIKGVGWSRGGVAGTTAAYMVVNGVQRQCVQNQGIILDSTDTNFVCWTPPLTDIGERPRMWWVPVTVQVVLTALDGTKSNAACAGSCTFYYDVAKTLTVGFASQGGYAGGVVKAFGTFRDANAAHYWMRVGGDHAGGGVGGALCMVDSKLQMGVNGNGGASNLVNPGGTILCRLGVSNATSEAGRYPLHIEPRDNNAGGGGYGQPFFSVMATQNSNLLPQAAQPAAGGGGVVSTQSIGFGITIWPLITGVSATALGLGGGVAVTITGAGFSTLGNNEVTLGNVPCVVTSSHMNSLTCTAGASASGSAAVPGNVLYAGGTGLMHKVYTLAGMGAVGSPTYNAFNGYINRLYGWLYWNTAKGIPIANEPALPAGVAPQFAEVNADSLTSRFGYYGSYVMETFTQVGKDRRGESKSGVVGVSFSYQMFTHAKRPALSRSSRVSSCRR